MGENAQKINNGYAYIKKLVGDKNNILLIVESSPG